MRGMFFNRVFGLKDVWRLRLLLLVLLARVFQPAVFFNLILYFYNVILKRAKVSHRPFYAMIEPSSRCNLKCRMCWRTLYPFNRPETDMPLEKFTPLMEQLGPQLIFAALWNYGEPFLNRDLPKMVEACSRQGIVSVLSTNASLLEREQCLNLMAAGLKYLIISVDGVTEDVYQHYRVGARLSDLEKRVRALCGLKKEMRSAFPFVEVQLIVMRGNEHQVGEFLPMMRAWGADRVSLKKFSALRRSDAGCEMLPLKGGYRLDCHKDRGEVFGKFCAAPWQMLVVNADGGVVPCCSDYFSARRMGNVFYENVDEIWNNGSYGALRQQMRENRAAVDICADCPHRSGQAGSFIAAKHGGRA